MKKSELAVEFFKKGYNCSQSVICAFADECDFTAETAAKTGLMLGGGVGRMREVCGAVSGMGIVLGLIKGQGEPCTAEEKGNYYKEMQFLAEKFKEKHSSIICRDILKLDFSGADSPEPEDRNAEYYKKRPCAKCVADTADILEEYLNFNKK